MSSQVCHLHDPFVDSSTTSSQKTTPSCEKQVHMAGKGNSLETKHGTSRRGETLKLKVYHSGECQGQEKTHKQNTTQESKKLNSPASQLLAHIPRGPATQRQGQELVLTSRRGGRPTSEQRSSIPIPVRSPQRLGSRSNALGEGFSGGIRVVEKPRGPRPPIQAVQKEITASSSVERAPSQAEETNTSSSPLLGDWEFREMPKRPTDVYTGEYRIRPILRIAASAEKMIMGHDSPGSTYAVTQRSNPAVVQYPDTPKRGLNRDPKKFGDTSGAPGSSQPNGSTGEDAPVAGPSNRSQISLETLPKGDTNGRQFSIPRKPVNSPSLSSLFVPCPESMQPAPSMPKLPGPYEAIMKRRTASGSVTPTEIASPQAETFEQSPGTSDSEVTIKPQPKQTVALQAMSDFSTQDEPTSRPVSSTTLHSSNVSRSVENPASRDIVSRRPSHNLTPQSARIPDSRSTRMLGGFRNIFKHRSTVEKGKRTSDIVPGLAFKDPESSSAKLIKSPEYSKLDPGSTGFRAGAKYPKLSESWNKNLRLPRPSSRRPTISAPIPISPGDGNIPSFARPTMATRTRAVTSPREQKPTTPHCPAHRIHTVTATTGSPQRVSCPSTGTQAHIPSVPKKTILPHSVELTKLDTITSKRQSPQIESSASDSLSETLNEIRLCVEHLCNKARDEKAADKREWSLRMALSLQQQISDYNTTERESAEAEALFLRKRADKCVAENSLFESYAQVRAQMDGD
ncbi:hypothetical protein BDV23DRAFT_174789 [Aspergillus alliaceus]|uniref:Uncharacterized protein n=1 Tax=Petromyces alliaceus TaxID=209559 RepID=A0A5N7BZR1_PETAA|nr:hypothetical protein BDV23DRAFT_174789 [Aspergillus alliaceus]